MRVQSWLMSSARMDASKSSPTLRLMLPEAFLRMWRNASYSPWMSATKCSVPLGRLRIASRFMISVDALWMVRKLCDSSSSSRRCFSISARV